MIGIEGNAYVFNDEFPDGEVVGGCLWCDRDAMRYEDHIRRHAAV